MPNAREILLASLGKRIAKHDGLERRRTSAVRATAVYKIVAHDIRLRDVRRQGFKTIEPLDVVGGIGEKRVRKRQPVRIAGNGFGCYEADRFRATLCKFDLVNWLTSWVTVTSGGGPSGNMYVDNTPSAKLSPGNEPRTKTRLELRSMKASNRNTE